MGCGPRFLALAAFACGGWVSAYAPAYIGIYSDTAQSAPLSVRDSHNNLYRVGSIWDSVVINKRAGSDTFAKARLELSRGKATGNSLVFASGQAVLDGKAYSLDSVREITLYRHPRFTQMEKQTIMAETVAVPLLFLGLEWVTREWKGGGISIIPVLLSVPITFGAATWMMSDLERTRILVQYEF